MLAAFTEKFTHQIGCAIKYLRMATESFGAMHVTFNADNLLNFVQIPRGGLELCDSI